MIDVGICKVEGSVFSTFEILTEYFYKRNKLSEIILSFLRTESSIGGLFLEIFNQTHFMTSEFSGIRGMLNSLNLSNPTEIQTSHISTFKLYNITNDKKEFMLGSPIRTASVSMLDLELLSRFSNRKIKPMAQFLSTQLSSRKLGDLNTYFYLISSPDLAYKYRNKFYYQYLPLFNTITQTYDILKPFNIILDETLNNTSSGTNNRTRNLKDVSTGTNNHEIESDDENVTSTDSSFAFNDTVGKPVDRNETTSRRSATNSSSSMDESTRTGTDNYSTSRSENHTRAYTRSGNIGNRSNSQLIEEERKKLMFDLREYIINDIADSLCSGTWVD